MLLGGGQVLLSVWNPPAPLPELPLLGVLGLVPLLVGQRIVGAPGAASAVCGAYLLPRTLISLVEPGFEPPPLLLVPAVAFDVCAWLRAGDLANLSYAWPRTHAGWHTRDRGPRR